MEPRKYTSSIKFYLCGAAGQAIAFRFNGRRKVRTAKSNVPRDKRGSRSAGTDSATENNRPGLKTGIRVKMWGKSPRLLMVTSVAGKPYMLKCHV